MTLDDTVVLNAALAQVHGSMDCTRTADVHVFEDMMLVRAKEIYAGATQLNVSLTQAAYALLGAYELNHTCFHDMIAAYWHAHARPELQPEPAAATFTIDELLMYADALCLDVNVSKDDYGRDFTTTIDVTEPDPETLGTGHGPKRSVSVVRAFIDLIRRYGIRADDGTLVLRDIKLADEPEPEEEWRPFDSAKELVGLDCPRIDWIKDNNGPLQEVGIRLKDGHHIRLRPDVEPCYSGNSVKLDGYALARCIIRVEERIRGGEAE